MPVHDWTKVDAGIFHAFHHIWITAIHGAVSSQLPPSYYCLPEQVAGVGNPDVLTLQFTSPNTPVPAANRNGTHKPSDSGRVAVITTQPKARFTARSEAVARRPKSVVVRHVTGHRVVAIIEVVSPNNKASEAALKSMAEKAANFLRSGVHLLFLDLFPPSARDPNGIHPIIWSQIEEQPFTLPADKPLTLVSYSAGLVTEAFIEPVAVGDPLPDMPLFLTPDAHVPVPLEATYCEAWAKIPSPWREVLEPSPT
jgi:hypothetical protein